MKTQTQKFKMGDVVRIPEEPKRVQVPAYPQLVHSHLIVTGLISLEEAIEGHEKDAEKFLGDVDPDETCAICQLPRGTLLVSTKEIELVEPAEVTLGKGSKFKYLDKVEFTTDSPELSLGGPEQGENLRVICKVPVRNRAIIQEGEILFQLMEEVLKYEHLPVLVQNWKNLDIIPAFAHESDLRRVE